MSEKNSILIIDDNDPILKLLQRSLSSMGYSVVTASDGNIGIQKLDEKNYSLVFTDMIMPGKSGKQVLEHSKKSQKTIPVIGMSGTPWLLEGNGFDAVLSKPFSITDLRKITKQFIHKSI